MGWRRGCGIKEGCLSGPKVGRTSLPPLPPPSHPILALWHRLLHGVGLACHTTGHHWPLWSRGFFFGGFQRPFYVTQCFNYCFQCASSYRPRFTKAAVYFALGCDTHTFVCWIGYLGLFLSHIGMGRGCIGLHTALLTRTALWHSGRDSHPKLAVLVLKCTLTPLLHKQCIFRLSGSKWCAPRFLWALICGQGGTVPFLTGLGHSAHTLLY